MALVDQRYELPYRVWNLRELLPEGTALAHLLNRRAMEISASLTHIWDFQNLILDSGRTPSVQFVSFTNRKPTDEEVDLFDVDPDADLHALERLFWADETPVIFSTNLFPSSVFCTTDDDIRFDLPIHEFLVYHCNQKIGYSINNLSAVEAPPKLAQWLHIKTGKPVLQFVDFFYSAQDEVLMYGHNFYDDRVLAPADCTFLGLIWLAYR